MRLMERIRRIASENCSTSNIKLFLASTTAFWLYGKWGYKTTQYIYKKHTQRQSEKMWNITPPKKKSIIERAKSIGPQNDGVSNDDEKREAKAAITNWLKFDLYMPYCVQFSFRLSLV